MLGRSSSAWASTSSETGNIDDDRKLSTSTVKSAKSKAPALKSHSRFIPETERGWSVTSSPMATGSSVGPTPDCSSKPSSVFPLPKLPSMPMRWPLVGSPERRANKRLESVKEHNPPDDCSDEDARVDAFHSDCGRTLEVMTSNQRTQRCAVAERGSSSPRLRTASDPASPGTGIDTYSRPLGRDESQDSDSEGTSRRRTFVNETQSDSEELTAPALLSSTSLRQTRSRSMRSRSSSSAISLRSPDLVPAPSSSKYPARGFAWRSSSRHSRDKGEQGEESMSQGEQEQAETGFVKPSHRNPTATQAFYDTHFGASSGWKSVRVLADPVLHPFESVKRSGWLSNEGRSSRRRSGDAQASQKVGTDRQKQQSRSDIFAGWAALPTLGLFGSSTDGPGHRGEDRVGGETSAADEVGASSNARTDPPSQTKVASSDRQTFAYEPELIPTVHRDANSHAYFRNLDCNVVIMGGYRGSVLRDAQTKQMMWVPLKVGVGLRRPTLELGLDTVDEDKARDLVLPGDMLGGIGHMVDMGRRLRERCQQSLEKAKKKCSTRDGVIQQADVYSWGYDWRLSLGRASKELQTLLLKLWEESAPEEANRRGACVVAHSMGGLVALHALGQTQKPEIFRHVIFASTPFLGTANILGPFRFGDAALFNDTVCSPRATFSFRSSFYLLPTDPGGGRCFEEEDGQPHDVDFLDPATWNDLGLSPCVPIGARSLVTGRQSGELTGKRDNTSAKGSAPHRRGPRDHNELDEDRARDALSFPGPDLQMMPSPLTTQTSRSSSDRPQTFQEATSKTVMHAALGMAQKGQQVLTGAETDDLETLQPANRRENHKDGTSRENVGGKVKGTEAEGVIAQEDEEDEGKEVWLYLERVRSGLTFALLPFAYRSPSLKFEHRRSPKQGDSLTN